MSGALITHWEPEDARFWDRQGSHIARRNLWISILCLILAFSTWVIWSIVVLKMPALGFPYSKAQLFMLTALPSLSGATLRIFYSFLPAMIGGRKWTAISTGLLLIPSVWLGFAVQDTSTPYGVMLAIALLCGFGGGNFSSSMANIGFFYPQAQKGYANGLNAGLGNLGVSLTQFLVPIVIGIDLFGPWGGEPLRYAQEGSEHAVWLQNAGFIWVLPIAVAMLVAWFGMNDIASARASFREQAAIFRRPHMWLLCWLYLGTFGSYIGFAAGFALLANTQFPQIRVTDYAFIGPLIGALVRPVGGWLADRIGGARVSLVVFGAMVLATFGVLGFLPGRLSDGTPAGGNFWGFFLTFQLLFLLSGIGNGSVFRMIPVVFAALSLREAKGDGEAAQREARLHGVTESAAATGFAGAIGAYGGFVIPNGFGASMNLTGSAEQALYVFMLFYLSCAVICWAFYARKHASLPC
ncbi:NarK family nitrate/nitrite MFS transporter [Pseudogulbenkiania sp. MAI-1]|uniref:NarK family nitrate/nitrite MFS transporter n=1 Tax=Pseudogulbenkiania sp. MAI-1 TaxID=990370 RepID=UPI00045E5D0A|nr:NarK family nitrate/nitrite MFS transporter [Pseudogulbenkiania sp. MAI-1]